VNSRIKAAHAAVRKSQIVLMALCGLGDCVSRCPRIGAKRTSQNP
jgi:hypothetical protein